MLDCDRLDGFIDTKLRNDVEYWYYVVAVYAVNGRRITSRGVAESVMPHAIVAPIENLTILRTDGGEDEYGANWEESHHNDGLLLAAPNPPELRPGQMVSVDQLLTVYRKLDIDARGRNSARFRFRFDGGMYVFAAAVAGRFATMGAPQYLDECPRCTDLAAEVQDGDYPVRFTWPAGLLPGVQAAWRFDAYPRSAAEPGASPSCTAPPASSSWTAACACAEPEPGVYYFRLSTVFVSPDGEKGVFPRLPKSWWTPPAAGNFIRDQVLEALFLLRLYGDALHPLRRGVCPAPRRCGGQDRPPAPETHRRHAPVRDGEGDPRPRRRDLRVQTSLLPQKPVHPPVPARRQSSTSASACCPLRI
jgi:hypothetical protein